MNEKEEEIKKYILHITSDFKDWKNKTWLHSSIVTHTKIACKSDVRKVTRVLDRLIENTI